MRRAAHRLLDDPRVHEDPLAVEILGPEQAAALRADPRRLETGAMAPILRAFLAVRSRVAEDALAESVAAGVRQYVILGAGLDTFAYRNPHPALRVFEVDHPATQAWKRERLAEARIAVPDGMAFVAVDFDENLPLAAGLRAAGLLEGEPAFFSWLGVTPYLEPESVLATLAALVPLAAGGGGVAFDYRVPTESLEPSARAAIEALAARVAAAGEPFRGAFEPEALAAAMRGMGFREIRDLDANALNAAFFAGRADRLRVGGTGHVLTAKA